MKKLTDTRAPYEAKPRGPGKGMAVAIEEKVTELKIRINNLQEALSLLADLYIDAEKELEDTKRWAKAWKAAAKVNRQAVKDLGELIRTDQVTSHTFHHKNIQVRLEITKYQKEAKE